MIPLPIDSAIPEIIESIARSRALVLAAEPGAGKTTRVPPALLESGLLHRDHPAVALLQPRRVAARTVAARIAEERGWVLGREVGHQVRFERRVGKDTRLHVITEGILTRRLISDPFLEGFGAVILDEFHERSIHTDLAIALVREARDSVREDLILVVMSATLDAEPIAQYLGGAPIIRVPGRTHPVTVVHRDRAEGSLPERVASAVSELVDPQAAGRDPRHGDILVFLPGVEEIRRSSKALETLASRHGLSVLPLHGSLPAEQQDRALAPSKSRKVILSTNIAETSLTIESVTAVVDSGLARVATHDAARGLDRLDLRRISLASAIQRAGRAGRTGPGICIRLWSEGETRGLEQRETPEIARIDLASTMLSMHAWGHGDASSFGWFEPPPPERATAAETLLARLEALDEATGRLTDLGRRILEIPAHPRLARMLLTARDWGMEDEGAMLAALLSEKDICAREWVGRARADSDLLVRLDLMAQLERDRFSGHRRGDGVDPVTASRVARLRDQFRKGGGRRESDDRVSDADEDRERRLLQLILLAYPDRVVRRRGADRSGVMVGGRGVRLEQGSMIGDPEFYVAIDPTENRRRGVPEASVRIASRIERAWLDEFFPSALVRTRLVEFDSEREAVVGAVVTRYHDLVLEHHPHASVDPEEAARVLAEAAIDRFDDLLDEDAKNWLARHQLLAGAMPELGFSPLDSESRKELLRDAARGRRTIAELKQAPWSSLLDARLDHAGKRHMREHAPEALVVPSGNRIRLQYEVGRPPVLAARLQELFGWTDTPRVAGGRVRVVLQLLGPNYRPVQITEDLRSFWSNTYFQVRKDLRGRYPKHSWPEDPLSAKPEAKGGRRSS